MTIERVSIILGSLLAAQALAIFVPWRRLFPTKPMTPPPPPYDTHAIYRLSWRWRAALAALLAFPVGLLLFGYLLAPYRIRWSPSECTPPLLDDKLHLPEALLLSAFAALCTLVYARAKNPAAYLKRL